ncbi:T9SS type A sorting domain-containing protein [Ekhidna sp.]|uniref:T9SS type A sorting domain-containing protein n=1 Tax=Ekhidna sp. TaxID=2608089 RepID=UPI003CCC3267
MRLLIPLLCLLIYVQSNAQTTFTSVGSGSFATTGPSVWSPSPIASDFTDGLNTFIVADGDVITIDGGAAITINSIEVGQGGGTGTLTIGNSSSAAALTLNGSLVIQSSSVFQTNNNDGNTHTVSIASDVVNNGGTFDLDNGTGLANVTLPNTSTSVLSGSTMVFNDLTINGGAGLILIASIDVNGNFVADASGTDITTTSNHNFDGNFTLTNNATFTATNSTQFFDGAGAQAIAISGGVANFNNLTFDNSNKTVTGNLISDGTFEITADAIWTNNGGTHQIAIFEVKNAAGVALTGGSVTFTGGEIRFGDNAATDGTIDMSDPIGTTGPTITFDGNCSIERDDQLTVEGDVEITADGYLVINGTDATIPAGESDSELNIIGTRTLTMGPGADLFIRGYDNFPTGFTTYSLDLTSLVRYDADFDQLIVGENSANTTIPYGRLYLSQDDASAQRTRQLLTSDDDLQVNGQFDMVNGVQFLVTHTANLEFGEDIRADDGSTAGSPVFNAANATVTMDANTNQVVDGPVAGNYEVDTWIITNTATPTTTRTVFVDDNIAVDIAFTVANPNGTAANSLIVDLDDNQIFAEPGDGETFTLGSNCIIYTSTDDTDGFAEAFDDGGDVINIDANSIVRFDRTGNQSIPNFNGGVFGNIQFAGSGNKYISNNLNIDGDVTRVGGTPVFRPGTLDFGGFEVPVATNHTVSGNWNMGTAYTGDSEQGTITFDGVNQNISASDFNNVVFSGSGTKTITGTLLINGDITINDAVSVNAGSEAIDIAGNWTENGTGTFTQSGSTTDFNGGGTQTITQNTGSMFNDLDITNNTTVDINSTVQIGRDLDIADGSDLNIEGETIRVSRDIRINNTATISYSTASSSIIIMDGSSEQDLRNINASQNFPTLQFEGVGNKELVNNILTVEGDLSIANESTFQGNGFEINFEGSNWTNNGNFQHNNSVNFLNNGGSTSVSTSSFHDIEIGTNDGSVTTTVTLAGNITLSGEMNIFSNGTLDVSASNYAITVEEDWNNYGVFNARNGTVTFTGGQSDFRSFSLVDPNSGAQADKAFFNLTINTDPDSRFDVEQEGVVLNDQIDVLNNLTITTGIFRLVEDDGDVDPGPALLNVGGSLINQGNGFEFRQEDARIRMNGTSGTHNIDLGGDQVRDFEINASGATYQLTGDFLMRDDTDNAFELSAGTLHLNGNILTVNRGGLDMSGGTLVVDEGASLLLNDIAVDPDFNKTGGTLQIVGIDGSPATLSSIDDDGFTFTQTSGDFQARYYTIANTSGDGIRLEGGTIDTGGTGNNFSDGTFTSGAGTSYLTLANLAIGNIVASDVIFNAGPANNVAVDLGNLPSSGDIEFVVAGGSLAGPQDELDSPDGGATTGYIQWSEDPGFTWTGGAGTTAWNTAGNWNDTSGDPDGIPDADDIIYIENAAFDPVIAGGESFTVARITIRNNGVLTFTGDGSLTVNGNFTVFSGSTVDMSASATSTLNIGGAWANAGTFNEGTATVSFIGTSGTHSITTLGNGDPFYNLTINGNGATYTLGSILTVGNAFTLSDGTFDGSSGFDIFINNDWTVNGGTFSPGQGRVRFNGTSGTQSISGGTMWDVLFEGAADKSIDGNISAADDLVIAGSSGTVLGNDRTIFVGGNWDLNVSGGFDEGTGTVIFNGTATQNLLDRTFDLTFNNVIFQNAGVKNFLRNTTINGNLSVISENTFVDFETGVTVSVTGTLSQTGGEMRIFDSNFPTATGGYSLTGGEVEFRNDGAQTLPADVTFNDIEIRDNGGGSTTATLLGDITVNDDLVLDDGAVTLDVAGFTITLGDVMTVESDEVLTWNGGTLIHTGDFWGMDADFNTTTRSFENLILNGTDRKRPNSDIAVNGNLTVGEGVELEQLTWTITNDGGDTYTMEQNAILDNRVVGVAFPTGFASYSIDPDSRVDLQASGNQTIFTNSGTLDYGELRVFTVGTATLDGDLIVQGDFDMNGNSTLADGGFDITLNGSTIDIQDYTPTAATTITFSRSGDQLIMDNDGSGQDLVFENAVFGGGGTKTLTPNAGDEVTDISGTVTINSGVIVTTNRGLEYSGSSWTNNGQFTLSNNARPLVFDGGDATIDPGTNDIAALTVSNTGGTTVTIQNNGFDLGTGDFNISANAEIDFSNLTHNLESESVINDASGSWILTGATLDFDQNGGQNIPVIDEGNANITGAPSIILSVAGTKTLTGSIIVDDLTIGANTNLDVTAANNYQITVNGSWDNNGGDFFEREGTVVFNADDTNAKTIDPNGEDFATVVFQGTATSPERVYTLESNMQVEGNDSGAGLTLAAATLDLNGNILTLGDNDSGDPDAELNIIGADGTLMVDAGATLQFNTFDDGGDVADTEIGGNLDVQSGGILSIVGNTTDVANVTRSDGGNRIDINIESGGEIAARYYNIQYLTDEGLEVEDGATVNATNNFSNGTFSNLETDAGDGTGGDDNPIAGNRYLTIESDAALTISDVVFNFDGSPTIGQHYNVTRSNAGGNLTIDWNNTSGPLGRTGFNYEEDGAGGSPPESTGQLTWDLPLDTQWTGALSTDWSTAGNWDNGIPSISGNDREAIINLGSPFNPTIETGDGTVNISALVINDGILKVISSGVLDLDGDLTLGDGTGGALIMDNTSSINVEGSWTTSANAIFDNGDGTVTFDAAAGATVSIAPGDQNFNSVTFTHSTAAGDFNIVNATFEIEGDLIIENSAKVIPSTNGYVFSIAGDITSTGGEFDTNVDGEVVLSGSDQTITDMSFDELTASGSGAKTTSGTTVINDDLDVESGVILSGGGAITMNGDVYINGTFNGVASQTYTFTGDDWNAAANSYTGAGTVVFNRLAGTQYIRQITDGDNPVAFNNLTLSGNAQIQLGRLIGGDQTDGNIDISGDLVVNNTINILDVNDYLIDNTSGTGTFTLADGEVIRVEGANNFPSNFGTYNLADGSFTYYYGTIDQTVRGGVTYGNFYMNNATTKTLGGNIDIDGDLLFRNSVLDASASNYSINLAGRWDTNNGNDDGSFIARDGTVTFDGAADQVLDIAETGTQTFNNILVNKTGGNVEVATSNMTISGDINVFNGTFDGNGLTVTIGGNMNASGTGQYANNGNGLYYLNASSGTPTIGTNESSIDGDIEINAPGRTYELVDDFVTLGNFTLTAGTLDVNGQTLSIGNFEDVVDIFGTLNVSTATKPGGTLALGNDVQLVVNPGGTINIVGTSGSPATVTSTGTTDYIFSVTGTGGNPGNIAARNYLIEYVGADGIYINANTVIDATNNFSDGTFQNGFAGGKYLRIENDQDLTGSNRIENVVFDDNPGGGATNVFKSTAVTGDIEIFNYSGSFSGEDFDEDPNDLITWLDPPTVTWTGAVSNDWFTAGNWDSGSVPLSTQNVIIPQTLNEPIITDNISVAEADNLTLEVNAALIIDTDDADAVDLQIGGDLVFEASSRLESIGTDDDIEVGGSWLRLSTALFTKGTSEVTFNSIAGTETISNSNGFYDLIINVSGTATMANSFTVTNDFTVSSGTFSLGSSDLTVGGNFSNSSTINSGARRISLIPTNATSPKTFDPGSSAYNSITIGALAGNNVEYDLQNDLTLNRHFNLVLGTVDPNGNDLNLGNSNGIQDNITIGGTILVEANERLALGNDAVLVVSSGGDLRFNGSDDNNVATLTRRSVGSYDFTVQSGGTFEANFFLIEHMEDEGIWLQSGATLASLDDGTFQNGSNASYYLRLSNDLGTDLTATNISFNTGPTNNVRRNEGAGSNVIFADASGAFSGPTFELDDGDPSTGEIRWTYTNPLRVWVGGTSTQWDLNANWEDEFGTSPATFPTSSNTVQIPDVSAGSNRYPVIDAVSGDEAAASVTIFANAELTIDDGQTLTIANELSNSGTITIPGTTTGVINVGDSWTNNGTFVPGNSTVTFSAGADVTVSGGASFYNLTIDGAGTGAGIVFSSSAALDVDNDFTITDGVYQITDASHSLTIGGDFIVDATNGSFVDNVSTVTFDGDAQDIGSGAGTTISFFNLSLAGTGVKMVREQLDINGDLSIGTGTTLALSNETVLFAGSSLDVDGSVTTGGTSSLSFDGGQIQVITGNSGSISLDNIVINNTAAGNNDVQLNIDLNVGVNANFADGIVQSSGSNPLIFTDNSTVSYDGVAESTPTGITTDGNSYAVGPVVKIGDDDFVFPIGEGSRHGRIGISSINSSSATDRYSAEYFYTQQANISDPKNGNIIRVSSLEYWDLINLNAHSGEPLVTLYWDAVSEVTQPSSLTVAHYNGASWDDEGNGSTTGTASSGTITSANNFDSFSPITLATTDDAQNPLPVELISFFGKVEEGDVRLQWTTASEQNNAAFEVQRSKDGINFEALGSVDGNGTTSEESNYSFTDKDPYYGLSYYRLIQVDYDGTEEILPIIQISNKLSIDGLSFAVYPNPTSPDNLNISIITEDENSPLEVRLTNQLGQSFYHKIFDPSTKINQRIVSKTKLTPGIYFLVLKQGNYTSQKKIIVK